VTLHVGAGTFKPVKTDTIDQHEMHAEYIDVDKKTIENIIRNLSGTIIPVGTTSLRTLESLYWIGVKKILEGKQRSENNLTIDHELHQWEAYDLAKENISVKDSLQSLLQWMDDNNLTG
jgi:S-adenosylmethionine:tRNA ribosyltransferase-isomerase